MSEPRDPLVERVERQRARRERHAREGERSLAQNLALAGTVGWLVVVPALLGIALGRYLDGVLDAGITCTAALVFLGIACGSYLAYRRIRES